MLQTTETRQTEVQQKRIEDLGLQEVDMIYSLARIGEWTDFEIGTRYGIATTDVRKVIDQYEELRKTAKKNPSGDSRLQSPSTVTHKEGRGIGRNARYGSNRERQAAYRARLREKERVGVQSPTPVTDAPAPVEEELSPPTIDSP
jgi:hypothetical protein